VALVIEHGTAVLPDRLREDAVLIIEDGYIREVGTGGRGAAGRGDEVYDAQGRYVLPGLIDLHSDAVEKEVEPRPYTRFPLELALSHLERRLAAEGITTVFHSLSFAAGEGIRADRVALEIALAIADRPWSVIRNHVHVRWEVTNFESRPLIEGLLASGKAHLFSLMDHSPGQGQYQTVEAYAAYVRKTYRLSDAEIARLIEEKLERRQRVDRTSLARLVESARGCGVAAASHDDDSPAKVEWAREVGIGLAEFPINRETAERAAELGLSVAVGAPNVARGGSHNGNLSALDLIRAGWADLICSDYYSGSLLYAVFRIARELGDLCRAVRMATLNPAAAVGRDRLLGSLEPGKRADLIVVAEQGQVPVVAATFVEGVPVYTGRVSRR
jgi:alpha-D-ribose 1-methylphosphonate 5-triphosphate diphosphatase